MIDRDETVTILRIPTPQEVTNAEFAGPFPYVNAPILVYFEPAKMVAVPLGVWSLFRFVMEHAAQRAARDDGWHTGVRVFLDRED